ncbi:MAG: MoaD/ThiS family protein [Actinomycetota bacterium]|nr:MoaD/ThiS family protein [Actinomycetota bacterium]
MAIVTLRYWAAARDAAGRAEEQVSGRTLAEALAAGLASAGARDSSGRLELVLRRCSLLIDGEPVGTRPHDSVVLHDGAVVEVLPPFAGG